MKLANLVKVFLVILNYVQVMTVYGTQLQCGSVYEMSQVRSSFQFTKKELLDSALIEKKSCFIKFVPYVYNYTKVKFHEIDIPGNMYKCDEGPSLEVGMGCDCNSPAERFDSEGQFQKCSTKFKLCSENLLKLPTLYFSSCFYFKANLNFIYKNETVDPNSITTPTTTQPPIMSTERIGKTTTPSPLLKDVSDSERIPKELFSIDLSKFKNFFYSPKNKSFSFHATFNQMEDIEGEEHGIMAAKFDDSSFEINGLKKIFRKNKDTSSGTLLYLIRGRVQSENCSLPLVKDKFKVRFSQFNETSKTNGTELMDNGGDANDICGFNVNNTQIIEMDDFVMSINKNSQQFNGTSQGEPFNIKDNIIYIGYIAYNKDDANSLRKARWLTGLIIAIIIIVFAIAVIAVIIHRNRLSKRRYVESITTHNPAIRMHEAD